MSANLESRLSKILPRITSPDLLSSEGIGNEIACYLFTYPAKRELRVRDFIDGLMQDLQTHHATLDVIHLNLFDIVLELLQRRGLLDKTLEMQAAKGDAASMRALSGPLAAEKVRDFIAEDHTPADKDLILMSGVGSVWPMVRAHSLLNCLHTATGHTPLVMFYPGSFDGTTLRLFGEIRAGGGKPGANAYYRAFHLVPEDES